MEREKGDPDRQQHVRQREGRAARGDPERVDVPYDEVGVFERREDREVHADRGRKNPAAVALRAAAIDDTRRRVVERDQPGDEPREASGALRIEEDARREQQHVARGTTPRQREVQREQNRKKEKEKRRFREEHEEKNGCGGRHSVYVDWRS